jgi:hypothetical protein
MSVRARHYKSDSRVEIVVTDITEATLAFLFLFQFRKQIQTGRRKEEKRTVKGAQ